MAGNRYPSLSKPGRDKSSLAWIKAGMDKSLIGVKAALHISKNDDFKDWNPELRGVFIKECTAEFNFY